MRCVRSCALGLALVACGPVQSGTILIDAQAELAAAETIDAKVHAPFEYVAAEEYLHKAREEQSYAEYEVAVRFAEKARDCARLARLIAEARARGATGSDPKRSPRGPSCRPGPDGGRSEKGDVTKGAKDDPPKDDARR